MDPCELCPGPFPRAQSSPTQEPGCLSPVHVSETLTCALCLLSSSWRPARGTCSSVPSTPGDLDPHPGRWSWAGSSVVGNRQSLDLLWRWPWPRCCHSQTRKLEQLTPGSALQDVALGVQGWGWGAPPEASCHCPQGTERGAAPARGCAPSEGHSSAHVGRTPGTFRRKHQEREKLDVILRAGSGSCLCFCRAEKTLGSEPLGWRSESASEGERGRRSESSQTRFPASLPGSQT